MLNMDNQTHNLNFQDSLYSKDQSESSKAELKEKQLNLENEILEYEEKKQNVEK